MRDILKRIFIGVVIGMALFFLKSQVFAMSLDEQFISNVQILNSITSYTLPVANGGTGTSQSTQTVTFKSSITPVSGAQYLFIPYTGILVNEVLNESSSSSIANLNFWIMTQIVNSVQLMNSNGTSPICTLESNYIVCPVSTSGSYGSLRFMYHTVNVGNNSVADVAYSLSISSYAGFYKLRTTSFESAITNQTNDLLDSDSTANKSYSNDYSNSDWEDAEENLDGYVDVDVSNVVFDPSSWVVAFTYIWGLCTSFVTANTKVFACVTSFLTLSFMGLVLGR